MDLIEIILSEMVLVITVSKIVIYVHHHQIVRYVPKNTFLIINSKSVFNVKQTSFSIINHKVVRIV